MTVAPGEIISDRYLIVEQLGEGGMGAVFRAEHVHMKKMVALKVLLGELARHPEVVARFEREAVAAANIEHPNIVNATDFGKLPDGSFFLVMEYVPGRSLRTELGAEPSAGGGTPLDPVRAIRITRGILSAIEAAHAKNIIHRDLKPENVMLVEKDGDKDFVKVLDFGIAKVDMMTAAEGEDGAPPGKKLTRTGAVMGTPEYMAPEQALGQPVDARSDLYSLGIILYELLAGRPPFHGEAIVIMRKQVLEAPPPLPESVLAVVPGIASVLEKLLQKEPANRYASANELRAALAQVEGAPVSSPRLPIAPVSSGRLSVDAAPGPSATADTIAPNAAASSAANAATNIAPKTRATLPETRGLSRKHVVFGGAAFLGIASLIGIVFALSSSDDAKAAAGRPQATTSATAHAAASASSTPSPFASSSSAALADDDRDDEGPASPASAAPTSTTRSKAGTASTGTKPATKRTTTRKKGDGKNAFEDLADGVKGLFK